MHAHVIKIRLWKIFTLALFVITDNLETTSNVINHRMDKKSRYSHTLEYYTEMRTNKLQLHATTWKNRNHKYGQQKQADTKESNSIRRAVKNRQNYTIALKVKTVVTFWEAKSVMAGREPPGSSWVPAIFQLWIRLSVAQVLAF